MEDIWFEDVDQAVLDQERAEDPEVWDFTEENE